MKILLAVLVGLAFLLALQYARRLRPQNKAAPMRPRNTTMGTEEAREVLGITAGASDDDIIDAHRRLMQKVHPDKGGNAYLAQQLNEAKRVLLQRS